MEIRLKEKLGMQSTLSRTKVEDSCTVPICVTLAMSPLGSLTEICATKVIEVKKAKEWIIWSMTPLSKIQLVDWIWEVLMEEEKTEYSRKGIDHIPNI